VKNTISNFKKGNVFLDTLTVLISLVVIGLVIFVVYSAYKPIAEQMDSSTDLDSTAKKVTNDLNDRYPAVWDSLFVFIFVLLWITVLISSFFIESNPAFFIVSLIILVIVLILAIFLGNSYEMIMQDATMSGISAQFPMTNFILSHILIFTLAVGVSIAIVLYAKGQG
jgi:hypothetical protein